MSAVARAVLCGLLVLSAAVAGETLAELLPELIADGSVVGAQALVGKSGKTAWEGSFGAVEPGSRRKIDPETVFCIGSVSKPLASSTVLSLADDGIVDLDVPINGVLPEFGALKVEGVPDPVSAPTLRQLLSHCAGIYSQKNGRMTQRQTRWIRDFHLTLRQAVEGIAREPLLAKPGAEYAYSGAGYCIVGRVAEVAARKPIETLLQERLSGPLGMSHTTYFPASALDNAASGADFRSPTPAAHPETPHLLGDKLALPLVGGSIYSTARDLSRFARMIAQEGRFGDRAILSPSAWKAMTTVPDDGAAPYALGFSVRTDAGRPVRLTHSSALAASRAWLEIDLEKGAYAIVLFTIGRPDDEAANRIRAASRSMIDSL